jgi:hypothetical protein
MDAISRKAGHQPQNTSERPRASNRVACSNFQNPKCSAGIMGKTNIKTFVQIQLLTPVIATFNVRADRRRLCPNVGFHAQLTTYQKQI